jgi:hypothetical protein
MEGQVAELRHDGPSRGAKVGGAMERADDIDRAACTDGEP